MARREQRTFYDDTLLALVPMGFCYPGKGRSGDLPPRLECAPLWHQQLLGLMPNVRLTILIGQYAQNYYLGEKLPLTETVKRFKDHLPAFFPLVHPSPLNRIWQKKNPWFKDDVLPILGGIVQEIIKRHITGQNISVDGSITTGLL